MAGIFQAVPIAFALAGLSIGDAAAQSFRSEYSVSLLGFTIARSSFDSSFLGDKFSVRGSVASAGLAQIFDSTKGTISSSGRFAGNDPRPAAYVTNYTSGRKKQKTQISFSGGNVSKTVNIPPLKKRGDEWVPVGPGDLRDVTDPISATLVRADRPKDVCRRTVKMFDGEMRANLVLDYLSTDPVTLPGYTGDAITCNARFVPVAGYKKNHKSIDYLSNRSKITVMFAPVSTTGIYAPVYATIGTQIGTITIRAKKFEEVD